MTKYRKKALVVDAFRITPAVSMSHDWPPWLEAQFMAGALTWHMRPNGIYWLGLHTLESDIEVNEGDWIVRGAAGEIYPVRDDIFRKTYERIESE